MREIWHWNLPSAASVAGAFLVVDAGFVAANMLKVQEGGYVPVVLAAVVYGIMQVWHRGSEAVSARLQKAIMPIDAFLTGIAEAKIARVSGTAVFLTRTLRDVPPVMVWHAKRFRALHERLFVLTVTVESTPWVHAGQRLRFELIAPDFWRAVACFGFMERPDIPALLREAHAKGCEIDLADVTYFVGHETVVSREDARGLPRLLESMFSFMQRNSVHASDYFRLPADTVVEIGRQIAI